MLSQTSVCAMQQSALLNWSALLFTYVNVPRTNNYTFYLSSDNGANLYVDGSKVVNAACTSHKSCMVFLQTDHDGYPVQLPHVLMASSAGQCCKCAFSQLCSHSALETHSQSLACPLSPSQLLTVSLAAVSNNRNSYGYNGTASLTLGYHNLTIEYQQGKGGAGLRVAASSSDFAQQVP